MTTQQRPLPARPLPAPARVTPLAMLVDRLREEGDPISDAAEALLLWTEVAQSIALTRFPDAPIGSRAHLDVTLAMLSHLVTLARGISYGADEEDAAAASDGADEETHTAAEEEGAATETSYDR